MQGVVLNVNMGAMRFYADKLGSVRKSALPTAIRNALNSAAFDVKQNTMPAIAKSTFDQRKPNFFKANSKVETAKGGNISLLKATVGFVGKDKAVKELKQQEDGGNIGGRSFITAKAARISGEWNKSVKANFRISAIKNKPIVRASESKGNSRKQKFIRAAIMAKKHLNNSDALVLGNAKGGVSTLSKINSVKYNNKKRTIKITRTVLYTYKKGRKVIIKETNFMKRASFESGLKIEKFFIQNAVKQLRILR